MYQPATRLLTMLELLQAHPSLSGAELARRLEVEPRSIRRYIVSLQDMGMPVEAVHGPGGGYRLRPGFKLPPLLFTDREAAAIVLGLVGTAWLALAHDAAAIEGALAKVLRVLPLETRERLNAVSSHLILSPHEQHAPPEARLLLTLSEASAQRRRLAIDYQNARGEATQRTIEPYCVAGWWGSWFVVGYCCLRHDVRTFRLDRIGTVAVLRETFERDESFDCQAYLEQQHGIGADGYAIEVEFQVPLAEVRNKVHAGYGTLSELPNGVLFQGRFGNLAATARYLVGLNLPFVVRQPDALRAELVALAQQLVASAGRPSPTASARST